RQIDRQRQRLALLAPRLAQALGRSQGAARQRIDLLCARLQALDPQRVLGRGYAWLSDGEGRALVSVAQLQAGQSITATLVDGEAQAEVREVRALRRDPP
ncbi:MAG TPA: exodeoxyribonuclease VII large subunit, partial [Methylibium sp.]|nr:exodeoxyribonuclease VII large subunit [Methylibium sp.]